ncbi:MAG: flavin reductase family protein [candidate division Zixibacteria bacterium]|nr:flavin reductase family protein [candidate division Zixibacteria bacterium]
MRHIEPKDVEVREVFSYLLGGVVPRPIALVSTLSVDGSRNLSPFSFFNAFGANPPMVAFAPSRRGRDGTNKDTYHNLIATKECVVQMVSYDMVEQVSLASTEYDVSIDEFTKSGLTPIASDIVGPPRVAESLFQMECKMRQMIELGDGPSSGNLAICEVVKFHIAERILDVDRIDPQKIDLVARMGADFYCRASGEAVFEVEKPGLKIGVGYDQIPDVIKESKILSANNLGQLGGIETIPANNEVASLKIELMQIKVDDNKYDEYFSNADYTKMLALAINSGGENSDELGNKIEQSVKVALAEKDLEFAWKALLIRVGNS